MKLGSLFNSLVIPCAADVIGRVAGDYGKEKHMRLIDADALIDELQCYLNQEMTDGPYPDIVSDTGDGIALAMARVREQPIITLNDLRDDIYLDAVEHGLWDGYRDTKWLLTCANLVREEANELCEASLEWINKPTNGEAHFTEELADVIIMCFSVTGRLGIDIDAAIRGKMEINKGRPWKHGKE